jgi:hypothetical protein
MQMQCTLYSASVQFKYLIRRFPDRVVFTKRGDEFIFLLMIIVLSNIKNFISFFIIVTVRCIVVYLTYKLNLEYILLLYNRKNIY